MSTFTPNYNLEKPDNTDEFKDFRQSYNNNMDKIDQNMGGGGGSSVSWQQLQVTGDKIATIRVSGIDTDVFTPNSQTFTMAVSRININSDETYPTIFGKIKKWFNDLKTVAFSGSYNDLSDQPTIPTATSDLNNDSDFVSDASYVHTDNNFTNADVTKLSGIQSGAEVNVQSNWNEADNTADDYIKNKPAIPTNTSDLNNDSGFLDSSDITVTQVVSTGTKIAMIDVDGTSIDLYAPTSGGGSVNDVTVNGTSVVNAQGVAEVTAVQDNPTFTEASTRANIASGESFATILGKIKKFFTDLKTVAFSGSYNDLTDKPTIPSAQVNSDWNANSGVAQILNKPSLATVATSGKSSDLNNDAGFITSSGSCASATNVTNAIKQGPWWTSGTSHNANDLRGEAVFAYNEASQQNVATTGTLVSFACRNNNYPFQLQSTYNADRLFYRRQNGDNSTWGSWRELIHSGNIGNQSVSYATSAGSATDNTKVAKTGDTMTGSLEIQGADLILDASNGGGNMLSRQTSSPSNVFMNTLPAQDGTLALTSQIPNIRLIEFYQYVDVTANQTTDTYLNFTGNNITPSNILCVTVAWNNPSSDDPSYFRQYMDNGYIYRVIHKWVVSQRVRFMVGVVVKS